MTLTEIFLLVAASILAGAINSVAGGGTFFAFPALIFAGVPPIAANATSTIAVWPGAVASAWAYRHQLRHMREKLPLFIFISLMGGGLGAWILLQTPSHTFEALIPWLLLTATFLFAYGQQISSRLRRYFGRFAKEEGTLAFAASCLLQFIIAIYGGYFGAGIGILMLAMLALLGMRNLHEMNGMKTILGSCINGVAVVIFIFSGIVYWSHAAVMIAGAIFGGYYGARMAQKFPPHLIRYFVIFTGIAMTIGFFF